MGNANSRDMHEIYVEEPMKPVSKKIKGSRKKDFATFNPPYTSELQQMNYPVPAFYIPPQQYMMPTAQPAMMGPYLGPMYPQPMMSNPISPHDCLVGRWHQVPGVFYA
ncbi:hypothetical protein ACOME3_003403 [Neoechinorhynchus agilis]